MRYPPRGRGARGRGVAAVMGFALAASFVAGLTVTGDRARAQGMAVPGKFAVSETGAATYEIPITAPPGTAGMVPSLSLSYNSHAGNGLLGMGWQLEGLPSLGRCPRTIATDGVRGVVNYDTNDRFCLDGQRLIAISGTYGADGTEYRTEIESFSKVVSRGAAGTGPAWFEVRTKTGQIMEFGNSADSRILVTGRAEARSWAVNKVSDTKGNYYSISYVNDAANGEAYPTRIDYTGNAAAGLAPYNSVRFVYTSDRPDKSTGYHAGVMVKSTARMSGVQTFAGATMVADYRLAYETSPATGRSRIISATLCDGAGTCLPATTFAWQTGTTNYTVVSNVGGQDGTLAGHRPYIADFNGDGLPDIFWDSSDLEGGALSSGFHTLWNNKGNGNFQVITNWLDADRQTITKHDPSCNLLSIKYSPIIGDFNRDGRADIWWYAGVCGSKNVAEARYSKSTQWFSSPVDGEFTKKAGPAKYNYLGSDDSYYEYKPSLADINGDGRPDFIWYQGEVASQAIWTANQDGSIVEGGLNASFNGSPSDIFMRLPFLNGQVFKRTSTLDFNGDGFSDIILKRSGTEGFTALLIGDGKNNFQQIAGIDTSVSEYSPIYADLNGDGQTDILWDNQDDYNRSKGYRNLWLSKGDGTFNKVGNAGGQDGTLATSHHRPYPADFDGDGLADILWDVEYDDAARSAGERVLWLNRGENRFVIIPNFSNQNGTLLDYAPNFGDFNGDGKTDILWDKQAKGDTRSKGSRVLWLSDGIVPDMLASVTDGVGASVSIAFKSMTDGSVYAKDNGASDPLVDVQAPVQLVSKVDSVNGIGGVISVAYAYAGAMAHSDGRGYLGFREMKVTDLQTGIVQTTDYHRLFPLTGLVANNSTRLNGLTLSASTNDYITSDLGGGRQRVSLMQTQTAGNDLNAVGLPSVTSSYQYDSYGNATQITVKSSDGYAKATINTYQNDIANWLLGRLVTAAVTSTAPAVADQGPARDATPNPFDFTDVTDATPSAAYEVSALISGIDAPVMAAVSGWDAQIRKNGGGDWTSHVQIAPGDTLNVRMSASSVFGLSVTAMVSVGTVLADWKITPIGPATTLTFHAQEISSFSSTIAVPSTVQKYDVLVLIDRASSRGGSSIPPAPAVITPPGFAAVTDNIAGYYNNNRQVISVKIADGTEAGSNITGMTVSSKHDSMKILWVFRPNGAVDTLTPGSVRGQGTNSTPSPQEISITGKIPVLALCAESSGNHSPVDVSMTPASDGHSGRLQGGADLLIAMMAHYKIYNVNPVNTTCSVTLDAGNSSIFQSFYLEVNGPNIDVTPDGFDFMDVADSLLSTVHEVSAVVSGFNQALTATVSGGDSKIRKNGAGSWSNSVSVVAGDTLNVQMTSADTFSKTYTTAVIVGNTTVDWRVTTAAQDDTPDYFDFIDITDALVNTSYEASAVVGGINTNLTATIAGGGAQIRKNGTGDWSNSIIIVSGDKINIRLTSGDSIGVTSTAMVRIGATTVDWNITTAAPDDDPDPFDFADISNATLSTTYETRALIRGINAQVLATVTNGEVRKNDTGSWGASVAINNGETLNVRMMSSATYSSTVVAQISAGSIKSDWRVTTVAPDSTPDPFDFSDITNATLSTVYETSTIIGGMSAPAISTVTGGNAEIRKNRIGNWGSSVSISSGDELNLRMTSSATGGATVSATVTVGDVNANWIIATSRLITVSGNVTGFNLRAAHDALYPAPTGGENPHVHVRVVIEPNAVVGATSSAAPAFTVGGWPTGIPIEIVNRGLIIGGGGNGGGRVLVGVAGSNGGTAFYTRQSVTLNNAEGNIAGGGGGGGAGQGQSISDNAGGGGGGAGVPAGIGGAGNPSGSSRTGATGTTLAGGNGASHTGGTPHSGGSGFGAGGWGANGRGGGGGGGPGASGGSGAGANGRAGGQPGLAIDGEGFVNYNGVGGIWGGRASGS